ncbi:MAG: hypothetical protein ABI366_01855 [Ginsengibacter sp.]
MKKKYAMKLGVVITLIFIFHRNIALIFGWAPHVPTVLSEQKLLTSRFHFWAVEHRYLF